MSETIVCRLKLTVTGTLVDGQIQWNEEIWTEGTRHTYPVLGLDMRDYEPEMCRVGSEALPLYGDQCATAREGREARQKAEAQP